MADTIKQKLTVTAGLSASDFSQLANHGVSLENVARHLEIYRTGIAKADLARAATANDGILKADQNAIEAAANYFEQAKNNFRLMKFVPASGAASRMFKFLNTFLAEFNPETETVNAYINRKKATELTVFFTAIDKFPFYELVLDSVREKHPDFDSWDSTKRKYNFIRIMLQDPEFNYSDKPKGVLPFHKYQDRTATPIEEHLNESLHYAAANNLANLQFTVSRTHQHEFENVINSVAPFPDQGETTIHTTFSYQDPATDTIAVATNLCPLRDPDGKLVLRPGGHGALLQNLNALEADIVFIKNIDNVVQDHIETIALYKKALGGILIGLQNSIFKFLNCIDNNPDQIDLSAVSQFLREKLNVDLVADFEKYTTEHKLEYLKQVLNRPLRVCGMVKNEGEPGGGPFWVRDRSGRVSLQIVEKSQIDLKNAQQAEILNSSTHFNPVDLVCGICDYKGQKFNLNEFIDPESGFIVSKNKNGIDLKAYELPGLWNGAMAKWNTVFVEVPLITFNPVKTVNDLLKPAHQPQ